MDRSISGFQLRRHSQAVFCHTAPSSHALWGACLLSPVATARRLGTIKLWNGHRPHADRSIVRGTPSAPTLHGGTSGLTAHLSKSHEPSDSEPFLLCLSEEPKLEMPRVDAKKGVASPPLLGGTTREGSSS